MSKPVVRLEARRTAPGQDDAGSGDPVGFLSVDQMADDIEGAEGVRPFGRPGPAVADVQQESRQRRWRPPQDIRCVHEVEFHTHSHPPGAIAKSRRIGPTASSTRCEIAFSMLDTAKNGTAC